jgi:hypothetical protein
MKKIESLKSELFEKTLTKLELNSLLGGQTEPEPVKEGTTIIPVNGGATSCDQTWDSGEVCDYEYDTDCCVDNPCAGVYMGDPWVVSGVVLFDNLSLKHYFAADPV